MIKIELLVEFGDGIKILLRVSQHRTNRAFSSQSRCYDDERDEEDHDDQDDDNNYYIDYDDASKHLMK